MASRLSHAVWCATRLLRFGGHSPDKSRSLAPAIAVGVALACASFALVVSILWLLAPEGTGFAARSVVVTLPFPPDEHPAGPPASAGIDGGLIVPPMTAAAFGHLPPLAPDAPLAPAPDPALIHVWTAPDRQESCECVLLMGQVHSCVRPLALRPGPLAMMVFVDRVLIKLPCFEAR